MSMMYESNGKKRELPVTSLFDAEGWHWMLTVSRFGVTIVSFKDEVLVDHYDFDFEPEMFISQILNSILQNLYEWYFFTAEYLRYDNDTYPTFEEWSEQMKAQINEILIRRGDING